MTLQYILLCERGTVFIQSISESIIMNMTSEPANFLRGTGEESPLPRLHTVYFLPKCYPTAALLATCGPFSQLRSF